MGNDDVKLETTLTVPDSRHISSLIYTVRNTQVMLDSDLAELYQVEAKCINEAVKQNIKRFLEHFCFQLTTEGFRTRPQIATSSLDDNYHGSRRANSLSTVQGKDINLKLQK